MSTIDILLVEDDPRDLELTLRTLKKNNIANHICGPTQRQALAFLQSGSAQPRLVLLDLKLPKVSGLKY